MSIDVFRLSKTKYSGNKEVRVSVIHEDGEELVQVILGSEEYDQTKKKGLPLIQLGYLCACCQDATAWWRLSPNHYKIRINKPNVVVTELRKIFENYEWVVK